MKMMQDVSKIKWSVVFFFIFAANYLPQIHIPIVIWRGSGVWLRMQVCRIAYLEVILAPYTAQAA